MKISKNLLREYRRQRGRTGIVGRDAEMALRAAKIKLEWDRLEAAGLVRIRLEPDESPDLSWIDLPENRRWAKETWRQVEQDGVWCVVGQYKLGEEWHTGDSVCGIIGPWDYIDGRAAYAVHGADIMAETIEALQKTLKGRCPVCRRPL